jgi:pimeloyl-ACP methyl ester carboxylesterase
MTETGATHCLIGTNGIRGLIAEQSGGPTVPLCHGFPECCYSWRHQLSAPAEAGPLTARLTEADIDYYTSEFTRTGFRGGLNWYRNIDRNCELLAPFDGALVRVPTLYIAGDRDPDRHLADLPKFVPQRRGTIMPAGCGHITRRNGRPRSTPQ